MNLQKCLSLSLLMSSTALFGANNPADTTSSGRRIASMKFEATVVLKDHSLVHASKIELGIETCRPITSHHEGLLHFAENFLNPATLTDYKPEYLSDEYEVCSPPSLWITERSNLIAQESIYLGRHSQILLEGGTLTLPEESHIDLITTPDKIFPRIITQSCSSIQAEWINIRITAQDNQWLPPATKTLLLKAIHSPFCENLTPDFRIAETLTQKWTIETTESDATAFVAERNDKPFLYSEAASPSLQKEAAFIDIQLRREASENPDSKAARTLATLDQIKEQSQYDDAIRRLITQRQQP